MRRRYAVIFERAEGNWAAYVPDLPGCTSRGKTRVEAIQSAEQALETWSRNTAPVGMAALMHRETGN